MHNRWLILRKETQKPLSSINYSLLALRDGGRYSDHRRSKKAECGKSVSNEDVPHIDDGTVRRLCFDELSESPLS